jgi:hypothetical protein
MTLCIYLRPDRGVATLAEDYSAQLAKLVPAPLVLGPNALPHVTLVHLSGADEHIDEVWHQAQKVLEDEYTIECPFYLSTIPFPDGSGHNFVRLELSRTASLAKRRMI